MRRSTRSRSAGRAGSSSWSSPPGLDHRRLQDRAPYDLIIANILAGPLIELAPALAGALAPGGRLILAGLLDRQAEAVPPAYRRQGMMGGVQHRARRLADVGHAQAQGDGLQG